MAISFLETIKNTWQKTGKYASKEQWAVQNSLLMAQRKVTGRGHHTLTRTDTYRSEWAIITDILTLRLGMGMLFPGTTGSGRPLI